MTTPASKNATMEGQYAFVEQLVGSIPELAQLVKNASAQGATPDAFQAMLQASNWWRTNSNTARQYVALQASDPTTYNQELTQAQQHVRAISAQMGVPLTEAQVLSYATTDLYQGLDDDQLKGTIGNSFTGSASTGATGDVADYTQQLQSLAAAYGVPVTTTWLNSTINQAMTMGQSAQEMIAGARATLINSATMTYPTLAQQLAAGQTTHDIAQPYIAAMSNILEIPDGNIDVTDQVIQKALNNPTLVPGGSGAPTKTSTGTQTNTTPTNTPGATTMPLWQFQDQLRADPRWQQTDNAKASAYSMVHSLGGQWGFAS